MHQHQFPSDERQVGERTWCYMIPEHRESFEDWDQWLDQVRRQGDYGRCRKRAS